MAKSPARPDDESADLLGSRPAPAGPAPSRPSGYLVFLAGVACLSTFNYGYHIGVLNTPEETIRKCGATEPANGGLPPCFTIDDALWGTIVAIFSIGGLVGGLAGGVASDRFGRKSVMLWNNVNYILGSIFLGAAANEAMLIVGRIFVGIGAGVATTVVPNYIGEVTPTPLRGGFGVLTQLAITLGILVAQTLGLYMSTVALWRWLLSLSAFVAAVQGLLLVACIESPRYLVLKGRSDEAAHALQRVYGRPNVASEVAAIQAGIAQSAAGSGGVSNRYNVPMLLRDRALRRPLLIVVGLMLAQQLSGINAVFYYSTSIFEEHFPSSADRLTVSIGVLNVLLTIVTVFLMDRAGRRVLLISCQFGMMVFAVLFVVAFVKTVKWLSILCIYAYVASFAIGLGPIPFLIMSELLPTKAVASAASIGLPVNWGANFAVALLWPLMASGLGNYAFLVFAGILVVSLVLTYRYVPETKGRTIEEITWSMHRRSGRSPRLPLEDDGY